MFSVPHEIRVGSAAIPRIIFQFQPHAFCFISMLGVGTYLRTIGSSISRYYRPSHTYCDFSQRMSPACQPHDLSLASERCLRVETEFPPLQRDHAARTPWNITAPCSSHPIEHNRLLSAYKNRCGSPPSRSALLPNPMVPRGNYNVVLPPFLHTFFTEISPHVPERGDIRYSAISLMDALSPLGSRGGMCRYRIGDPMQDAQRFGFSLSSGLY